MFEQAVVFEVTGCVNLDTVVGMQLQGFDVIGDASFQETGVRIDLDKAQIEGSAILALLISWKRYAQGFNVTLSFENAPASLRQMAAASAVDTILQFDSP